MSFSLFFTVNWRNDINAADCFIRYKDKFYDITRIDTFEGYKEDLKLYALLLASHSKPGKLLSGRGETLSFFRLKNGTGYATIREKGKFIILLR